MRVRADLEAGHVHGTVGGRQDGPVTEQGAATEGTAGPRPHQGNLRGLSRYSPLLGTCQGYSFFWTSCPPTIRFRNTFFSPHLQEVRGAEVTGEEGRTRQQEERHMKQESRRRGDHILQAQGDGVWEEQDKVFMVDCEA